MLQKTDSYVKVFKITSTNYEEEFGWEYEVDIIKFDKNNIIKYIRVFYTDYFESEEVETIKIDENTWITLETLYNKYKIQLDKVYDEWRKKEASIQNECMEELWKIL